MDFRFTEDQLELVEGAGSFLAGVCTPDYLRACDDGGATPNLWPKISEMGLLGVIASEKAGGLGLGAVEFALVAEAAGRVALPEPLVDCAGVIAPALDACGETDLLSAVVSGETVIAARHGSAPFVNADLAPNKILLFNDDRLRLVSAGDTDMAQRDSFDPLRRMAKVTVGEAGRDLATGEAANAQAKLALNRGTVFTSAEMLGLSSGLIDQATEYSKTREQFGAAIGTFQAVKHNLSNAFIKLEFARPLVYRAAAALDCNHENLDLYVSHAKLAAMAAASFASETAIQVHGAMGYTYEAPLHYWMKRVWALSGLWGDQSFHELRLEKFVYGKERVIGPGATAF